MPCRTVSKMFIPTLPEQFCTVNVTFFIFVKAARLDSSRRYIPWHFWGFTTCGLCSCSSPLPSSQATCRPWTAFSLQLWQTCANVAFLVAWNYLPLISVDTLVVSSSPMCDLSADFSTFSSVEKPECSTVLREGGREGPAPVHKTHTMPYMWRLHNTRNAYSVAQVSKVTFFFFILHDIVYSYVI